MTSQAQVVRLSKMVAKLQRAGMTKQAAQNVVAHEYPELCKQYDLYRRARHTIPSRKRSVLPKADSHHLGCNSCKRTWVLRLPPLAADRDREIKLAGKCSCGSREVVLA